MRECGVAVQLNNLPEYQSSTLAEQQGHLGHPNGIKSHFYASDFKYLLL